jgi:hypothetical protein
MAQQKRITHGATVIRVTGGPTTMGQCRLIQPPEQSREKVEVTTLDSAIMEYIPSDPEDMGELSAEFLWTDGETNDEIFDTDFNARTTASWRVTFPTSTPRTWTFDAWIMRLSPAVLETGPNSIRRTVTWCLASAITKA